MSDTKVINRWHPQSLIGEILKEKDNAYFLRNMYGAYGYRDITVYTIIFL